MTNDPTSSSGRRRQKQAGKPQRHSLRNGSFLFVLSKTFRIRKEYYAMLGNINKEIIESVDEKEKGTIKELKIPLDKIERLDALDKVKNANYGGVVGVFSVFVMVASIVFVSYYSFKKVSDAYIDANLMVSSLSFKSYERPDIEELTRSNRTLDFGPLEIKEHVGYVSAFAKKDGPPLNISFQALPDSCTYIIDYLSQNQLSIKFILGQAKGSIQNYDTVYTTDLDNNSNFFSYGQEQSPISFRNNEPRYDFKIVNTLPSSWKIGPITVDSLKFIKALANGLYSFSVQTGTIRFLEAGEDSIQLTRLDTLDFKFKELPRIYLEGSSDGIKIHFQGRVSELSTGPSMHGRKKDRMPYKFDVWVHSLPEYFIQLILTLLGSFITFLILRQRKAI
jgi:hypothetical protein